MRRFLLPLTMLGMLSLLGTDRGVQAQTLPPPTAPPQIVIVITPTPEVWPTETPIPSETPTPTATLTPTVIPSATVTPAYADFVAYATVQYGEDDPGRLTVFRYEMSAGDVLNAALLACVLGLLLLDVLLRLAEWRKPK
jgi:hypothetical protein